MDRERLPGRPEIEELLSQHEPSSNLELIDYRIESLAGHGAGGHGIFKLEVEYADPEETSVSTFVLKRWTLASPHAQVFGLTESYEAVAHRTGLFAALPASVHVPIVASIQDSDGEGVWLLMTDVSAELEQYGRPNQFPFGQVKEKVSIMLDRLAQMHVQLESSDHLAAAVKHGRYNDCSAHMSARAAAYRHALSEGATGKTVDGTIVDGAFVAQLHAFLDWLPTELRPMWERVLVDRSDLIRAANALPHTLLHGDLDDRNIGLSVGTRSDATVLTLIDWEWICVGPGGLDAAKPIHQLPGSFDGTSDLLHTYREMLPRWGEEYAEAYRRHGGLRASDEEVLHAYHLGHVREAMSPFPHVIGSVLMAMQREEDSVRWVPSMETNRSMFELVLGWGEVITHYVSDYMQTHLQLGR